MHSTMENLTIAYLATEESAKEESTIKDYATTGHGPKETKIGDTNLEDITIDEETICEDTI